MNIQPNFTNRETYIAWRANWRVAYKTLSKEIHDLKRKIKEDSRANLSTGRAQNELRFLREQANRMMLIREEAKALKAEQLSQQQAA